MQYSYPNLLTVDEVAFYLRLHPASLRRQIAHGQFPAIRIGSQLRIRRDDLEQVLQKRNINSRNKFKPHPFSVMQSIHCRNCKDERSQRRTQ